MKQYEITGMIIDDDYNSEEFVTVNFLHNGQNYSVTFSKEDLEVVNNWVFMEETSLPANLSDQMIESLREDVKKRI
ncbi:hypothetical protein M3181_19195 [Mesobacillus maritimus]|uniref:hypothetical protein n=1 Tax=Mesobacillus maritimus TaxID=1643336 RepID=UPI00203EC94C|nr:hypothetical protein [Mesobacillus maritimus]MCM3671090.1 hypothetical protein [Mesobacillus maritimus]